MDKIYRYLLNSTKIETVNITTQTLEFIKYRISNMTYTQLLEYHEFITNSNKLKNIDKVTILKLIHKEIELRWNT